MQANSSHSEFCVRCQASSVRSQASPLAHMSSHPQASFLPWRTAGPESQGTHWLASVILSPSSCWTFWRCSLVRTWFTSLLLHPVHSLVTLCNSHTSTPSEHSSSRLVYQDPNYHEGEKKYHVIPICKEPWSLSLFSECFISNFQWNMKERGLVSVSQMWLTEA